jgi:hypothetical protein
VQWAVRRRTGSAICYLLGRRRSRHAGSQDDRTRTQGATRGQSADDCSGRVRSRGDGARSTGQARCAIGEADRGHWSFQSEARWNSPAGSERSIEPNASQGIELSASRPRSPREGSRQPRQAKRRIDGATDACDFDLEPNGPAIDGHDATLQGRTFASRECETSQGIDPRLKWNETAEPTE